MALVHAEYEEVSSTFAEELAASIFHGLQRSGQYFGGFRKCLVALGLITTLAATWHATPKLWERKKTMLASTPATRLHLVELQQSDLVEQKRPSQPVEWEVKQQFVRVRQFPTVKSKALDSRETGDVVIGSREGQWLNLSDNSGYMLIGKGLLVQRFPVYTVQTNGRCLDTAQFPIIDSAICRFAASFVGVLPESARLLHVDPEQPEPQCHGVSGSVPPSNATICSSLPYLPPASSGVMSAKQIQERIVKARMNLLQGRAACMRVPKAPCTILWKRTLADMVKRGFGAALAFTVPVAVYGELAGCDNVVAESYQRDWMAWGMGPFWSKVLPDTEFNRHWAAATRCAFDLAHDNVLGPPSIMRCQGPTGMVHAMFKQSRPFDCGMRNEFELFLNQLMQVFGPFLVQYAPPFRHTYAALHVRHGEKVMENRPIYGLREHIGGLKALWPTIQRIFVTSDDAKIIKATSDSLGHGNANNITVRWTSGEKRWSGGAPPAQFENHDHDNAAVRAVLSDFSALALSPILVGNNGSCFYNSARLLNMAVHWDIRRLEPWCYDVNTRTMCDRWYFIYQDWGPGFSHSPYGS